MSQTPRGSDPYDYNPDYNRLNPEESETWHLTFVRLVCVKPNSP